MSCSVCAIMSRMADLVSSCLQVDQFDHFESMRHVTSAMLAGGICPNLVEFFDAFWEDPFMYLAMEYMDHGYIR